MQSYSVEKIQPYKSAGWGLMLGKTLVRRFKTQKAAQAECDRKNERIKSKASTLAGQDQKKHKWT